MNCKSILTLSERDNGTPSSLHKVLTYDGFSLIILYHHIVTTNILPRIAVHLDRGYLVLEVDIPHRSIRRNSNSDVCLKEHF